VLARPLVGHCGRSPPGRRVGTARWPRWHSMPASIRLAMMH
jgi:hypothetical protein